MKQDFRQILREGNEIKIHQRNLQVLMTEVYQIVNSIALPIMNSLFQFRCNTNNIEIFKKFRQNETVRYGTEIVTHRAPFVWANLHTKYKNAKPANIYLFKVSNRNSRKRGELF